jgi:F0F1-type ATP synthase assembly protein I
MFGFCVGIATFGGVLLDHAAGTSPLLALIGVGVGIVVGATGAYQVIRPYTQSMRNTPANNPNDARLATAEPDDDVRSDEQ